MGLEPRIEQLEARQPIDDHVIDEIVLVGIGHDGGEVLRSAARFDEIRWTPFEMGGRSVDKRPSLGR